MTTKTATQAHEAIQQAAEQASPELRYVDTPTTVRQGDVYFRPYGRRKQLSYAFARGNVTVKKTAFTEEIRDRQLAPGTTQGSRHIVEGDGVRIYRDPTNRHPLIGVLLVVEQRCTITHPEHAHISLPPGEYQVSFQDDVMQNEISRVRD